MPTFDLSPEASRGESLSKGRSVAFPTGRLSPRATRLWRGASAPTTPRADAPGYPYWNFIPSPLRGRVKEEVKRSTFPLTPSLKGGRFYFRSPCPPCGLRYSIRRACRRATLFEILFMVRQDHHERRLLPQLLAVHPVRFADSDISFGEPVEGRACSKSSSCLQRRLAYGEEHPLQLRLEPML
jgi:hypothetical protein